MTHNYAHGQCLRCHAYSPRLAEDETDCVTPAELLTAELLTAELKTALALLEELLAFAHGQCLRCHAYSPRLAEDETDCVTPAELLTAELKTALALLEELLAERTRDTPATVKAARLAP